jgi:hypothetical protein
MNPSRVVGKDKQKFNRYKIEAAFAQLKFTIVVEAIKHFRQTLSRCDRPVITWASHLRFLEPILREAFRAHLRQEEFAVE